MAYQCVVVGSDGSESALTAVRKAAEVAQSVDARLIVVTAYQQGGSEKHVLKAVTPEERSRVKGSGSAERAQETSLAAAQGIYPAAESVLVHGDPVGSLLSTAERQHGDLIVVGNQGVDARSARLLGSVPFDVVQQAPCDVLVAHTTAKG